MISKQGYNTILGYECLNACLANYMNFYNLDVSTSDIFFGGDGFNISVKNDFYFELESNLYLSNFNFLDNFNFNYSYGKCVENPIDFLRNSILGNKAISLKVSSEFLTYNRVFKQTKNATHFINAIGLEEDKNKIYISDGFVPTKVPTIYQGWVNLDDILRGWEEKKYEVLCMRNFNDSIKCSREQILLKVKEGITRYLYENKIIDKMLKYIRHEFYKKNDISQVILKCNYELKIYGFISSKRFLLSWVDKNLHNDLISSEYSKIIIKWNDFCDMILKFGFNKKYESLKKAEEYADALMEDEAKLLHTLLSQIE